MELSSIGNKKKVKHTMLRGRDKQDINLLNQPSAYENKNIYIYEGCNYFLKTRTKIAKRAKSFPKKRIYRKFARKHANLVRKDKQKTKQINSTFIGRDLPLTNIGHNTKFCGTRMTKLVGNKRK